MIVVKRLSLAVLGLAGLVVMLIASLWLLLAGGCFHVDLSKEFEKSIPPEEAVRKIDAELKYASIPSSFVGIEASEGHTPMGAGNSSIGVAFRAPRKAVDEFLAQTNAEHHNSWLRPTQGCGPPPPLPSPQFGPAFYDASAFEEWYKSGVFPRCATIEHWDIPNTEWRRDRVSGGVYRDISAVGAGGADTPINVVLTFVHA